MIKRFFLRLSLVAFVLMLSIDALAQALPKPTFVYQKFADYAIAYTLSDNGKWALVYGGSTEQMANGNARLLNVETKEITVIRTEDEDDDEAFGEYDIHDVTDDGNIVVGACNGNFSKAGAYFGKPGFWDKRTMEWTELPMPSNIKTAVVLSVTPDGKYAVGNGYEDASNAFSSDSYGIMWDLTTKKVVTLNNLPEMPRSEGVNGELNLQESFMQITADGRYIVIYGNQSYAPAAFIYDRQTETYFKYGDGAGITKYYEMEGEPVFSPNGKYIAATIRTEDDDIFPLLYNTETGKYTYYDNQEDNDLLLACVDNEGNVYASAPGTSTPVREWQVLVDNVWYPFSTILEQRYGINYSDFTGYTNTGTLWSASTDTKVLCSMVSPQGESYVVTLPEKIADACRSINLLNSYTAEPTVNSDFAFMEVVKIAFSHDITVKGANNCAVLKDKNGNTVRNSMGFAVDNTNSKVLVVTFRSTTMNAGDDYTVEIPAGTVALTKNESIVNEALALNYKGRANVPVNVTKIFPEDKAEVSQINNSSNPVYLTFDTNVAITKNAKASLIQMDGDTEKTICSLSVVSDGKNMVALVPAATQYLYKGSDYKVVLEAGSLTDVSGASKSANEQLVINYTGSYERQLSTDDATLFSEDFSDVAQSLKDFMRYEGDHNTPTADMQGWAFDADNQPWNFSVKESSSSTNYCAASTSMYSPAGQSDDWMVIPQITIPDPYCTLTFDAQNYLEDAKDILKVVVWECDKNINNLSAEDIANMKAQGDITEYELNYGETEEGIDGEFTHYTLDLGKYSGKKIYIGFWNNNNNQSVIFVDNVVVKRNLKYLMSLSTAPSVVNKNEVKIAGSVKINSDDDTYSRVALTLKDAAGNTVDTFEKSGLNLKKNDSQSFAFEKPLPLTVGEINNYTIDVKLDDYSDVVKSTIKDLTFEPTKRVVLEEMTGITCVNCPLGILAIENMKKIFGEQFIPISIHTYTGDPYGTGLYDYTDYLGLNAAPTGVVQRDNVISHPMTQNDDGDYVFSYNGFLWQDKVAAELDKPAEIGISVPSIAYNENTNKLDMKVEVQSALNLKNQYLNVFAVALEDGIRSTQVNNLYAMDDPVFGDWGKGGKYGYASVDGIINEDMARCYWGTSFSGTNVGFPQTLNANQTASVDLSLSYPDQVTDRNNGKLVIMLFDGNTDKLINSVVVKMSDISTGIKNVVAGDANDGCDISAANGIISVKTNGKATVNVYTVAGALINTASGTNTISVPTRGYQGAVIVKVAGETSNSTKKLAL